MKSPFKGIGSMLTFIHNPLGIKDNDEKLMTFDYDKDAYYTALKRLYTLFPGGFVDIPLFLSELQHSGIIEPSRRCGIKQYALIRDMYECGNLERNALLRTIMQTAVKSMKMEFDHNAMSVALYQIDQDIAEGKIAKGSEIIKVTLV